MTTEYFNNQDIKPNECWLNVMNTVMEDITNDWETVYGYWQSNIDELLIMKPTDEYIMKHVYDRIIPLQDSLYDYDYNHEYVCIIEEINDSLQEWIYG